MARVSDAHLEARRLSILKAARKVFSEKGVAAATMAEIAAAACCSPGAIYRYFESKDALAHGCMSESTQSIRDAWTHPEQVAMSFEDLARITFAELDRPDVNIDTQLFLEQMLAAVRDRDSEAIASFREESQSVPRGIRFMMETQFGVPADRAEVQTIAEALYSFYWGARLVKLLLPEADTDGQLRTVYRLIERTLSGQPLLPAD